MGVLWGEHGTFCAGADLKAVASGDPSRMHVLDINANAPMGISRMFLTKVCSILVLYYKSFFCILYWRLSYSFS